MSKPETDVQTADRLLGLADQFLDDWRESVEDYSEDDADVSEREAEWKQWRPRILACIDACAGMSTEEIQGLGNGELAACAQNWLREDD